MATFYELSLMASASYNMTDTVAEVTAGHAFKVPILQELEWESKVVLVKELGDNVDFNIYKLETTPSTAIALKRFNNKLSSDDKQSPSCCGTYTHPSLVRWFKKKDVVYSIRGSVGQLLVSWDWFNNMRIMKGLEPPRYDDIKTSILRDFAEQKEIHGCDFFTVTGHSLGGGLATLVGSQIPECRYAVSFDGPKILNQWLGTGSNYCGLPPKPNIHGTFFFSLRHRGDVVSSKQGPGQLGKALRLEFGKFSDPLYAHKDDIMDKEIQNTPWGNLDVSVGLNPIRTAAGMESVMNDSPLIKQVTLE